MCEGGRTTGQGKHTDTHKIPHTVRTALPHGKAVFECPKGGGAMAFRIQLNDHSEAVLAQMDANVERALTAMGIKAVGLIIRQMESGYTTPHKNRAHGKNISLFWASVSGTCSIGPATAARTRPSARRAI